MAEVAPISNDHYFGGENDNGYTDTTRVSWYPRALRKIALGLSISTFAVLMALLIILIAYPFYYKWEARGNTEFFVIWMSVIMVFCFINTVTVKVPSFLNTIADFVFTYAIIYSLVDFMGEFPHHQWCYNWGMSTPVRPDCVEWRLAVTILMGISSGFAIILGAIFVLLLLHRIYVVYTSKNWGTMTLGLPQGETSWTISLKITRSDNQGVVQEARAAPTGQGPVHI